MKVLKKSVTRREVIRQNVQCNEKLSSGQSITKAIQMSSRSCCGSSFVERVL